MFFSYNSGEREKDRDREIWLPTLLHLLIVLQKINLKQTILFKYFYHLYFPPSTRSINIHVIFIFISVSECIYQPLHDIYNV